MLGRPGLEKVVERRLAAVEGRPVMDGLVEAADDQRH
jgi:hypothetical protein